MNRMKEKILDSLNAPLIETFKKEGLTPDCLIKKLKEELNAKEEKVFHNAKTGVVYSKKMITWEVRQKARQDAHKLRGDYPAEKHEVSGNLIVDTGIRRPGDEDAD